MATTADIRNGICINYNHGIYKVVQFQHVKPGKGPAFVRTKLKNVENGKVIDNTFPSGHKIEIVRIENRKYQYLYSEGDTFHFMNTDDYQQIFLDKDLINAPDFLKEGQIVDVLFHAEQEMALLCDLPSHVILEITHSEPGVKGNTATNATKPATLETNATIQVPLFVNEGDKIKVDTEKQCYVERIKS